MGKKAVLDIEPLLRRLAKVPGAMEKELKPLIEQEARLFIKEVVRWTPPSGKGVQGTKAKQRGEAAVMRDIKRVYATPGDAYDAIAEVDVDLANAFWLLQKEGNYTAAADILNTIGGRTYLKTRNIGRFDDGTLHARMKRGRLKRSRAIKLVVTNPAALKRYIRDQKKLVGILSAGWNKAAGRLGVKLPAWVQRHRYRYGDIVVQTGQTSFVIVIRNKVRFGANLGLQSRVNAVLAIRRNKLKRRLAGAVRAAMKKTRIGSGN